MPTLRHASFVPHSAAEVRAWHERPGALTRLSPPWQLVRVLREEGVSEGQRAELSLVAGGMRRRWVARHAAAADGFRDVQERGPFARWEHTHRFVAEKDGTRLEDVVGYDLGLPAALARGYVERSMRRAFEHRHAQLAHDLDRHARYPRQPLRVAMTGAGGLLGSRLAAFLSTGGHHVARLSRGVVPTGADAIVHLAGEPISQRWTARAKREILRSRVEGTRAIAEAAAKQPTPPRALVVASAIGLYGDRGEERLDESSGRGDGFLPEVVSQWEEAAQPARDAGIRVVHARFGIVLAAEGGALPKLVLPTLAGAGGPLGSGDQWWSWVHVEDVVGALHAAIMDERLQGAVNVVAPEPARQREVARTLARVLSRPALAPAPRVALRAALGEMSAVVLDSARVSPTKLAEVKFPWLHGRLEEALRFELGR